MTVVFRELERLESRVLGALRCVDAATRAAIEPPLRVSADGARIRRNGSGLYVLVQADALAAHEAAFDAPPALPAPGTVTLAIEVSDPSMRYLPRLVSLSLPRDPAPDAPAAQSLFTPVELPMYPSPAGTTGVNWSLLRVTVRDDGGQALGGALLIVRSGGQVLARGLSDGRGEALVAVPGVPVTTWSDAPGAVITSTIDAALEVVFDPAAGSRTPAAELAQGREPTVPPVVDPDALEARRAGLPQATRSVQLAAGRSQALSIAIAVP